MKLSQNLIKASVLFVLAPAFIYIPALSKTIRQYREYRQVRQLTENMASDARHETDAGFAPVLSSGAITETILTDCKKHGISITGYEPDEIDAEDPLRLYSARLDLSGNFIPLIKTMAALSRKTDGVRIAACSFETVKKRGKESTIMLEMQLVLLEDHSHNPE